MRHRKNKYRVSVLQHILTKGIDDGTNENVAYRHKEMCKPSHNHAPPTTPAELLIFLSKLLVFYLNFWFAIFPAVYTSCLHI